MEKNKEVFGEGSCGDTDEIKQSERYQTAIKKIQDLVCATLHPPAKPKDPRSDIEIQAEDLKAELLEVPWDNPPDKSTTSLLGPSTRKQACQHARAKALTAIDEIRLILKCWRAK